MFISLQMDFLFYLAMSGAKENPLSYLCQKTACYISSAIQFFNFCRNPVARFFGPVFGLPYSLKMPSSLFIPTTFFQLSITWKSRTISAHLTTRRNRITIRENDDRAHSDYINKPLPRMHSTVTNIDKICDHVQIIVFINGSNSSRRTIPIYEGRNNLFFLIQYLVLVENSLWDSCLGCYGYCYFFPSLH